MNRTRTLLLPLFLCLAPSAGAQEMLLAPSTEGASLLSEPSAAAAATNTAYVEVRGTVSGSPESVSFTGQARVTSRLAKDPDFGSPRLVLTIDLGPVAGTGSASGRKYVISGPEIVQRRVATSHAVQFTFPFIGGNELPRSGLASFALDFNPDTGAITKASGRVASPAQ